MLLLLSLSIFFHYDLLHCGQEKANEKNEFMDYSITEFWWNGTPGIDQTDRNTPQYSFLPTPIGYLIGVMMKTDYTPNFPLEPSTSIEELETFYPFPNTTQPSYPFEIENHTVTPSRPGPWHIQYPGITPPSNFPSDYRYPTIYPYTVQSAYIPSPTGPPPKRPSFTLPKVDRPEITFQSFLTPPTPPKYPSGYLPDWVPSSTSPRHDYYPFTWAPEGEHVKKWQQGISSYAAVRSIIPTNVVPMISPVFNYDYTKAFRRIRKTTQHASSKLMNSIFEDPTRAVLREEITVLESNEARDSEFKDEASLYDPTEDSTIQKRTKNTQTLTTATMQSWITDFLSLSMAKKDDDRNIDDDIKKTTPRKNISSFLRIVETLDRTGTMPKEERWQSDQTVSTTLTTVKESLRLIAVPQSYFEMTEALQEGYMMVFLIELTRLIATKERKAVYDVVKHTDQIIYGFYQSGQLHWLGKPLIDVTTKVARLLKKLKIDVIQNHAANLHHMLSQRHLELSVEVNTILEYADMLYDDDEGRLLFDALKEFAAYPNISLTGYWLCNSLIHNFLRPYRRLKDTQQRQELMDSVNSLLKTRLSSIGFNEEPPLRDGDVKQADGSPDDAKLSTKKELVTQTEFHSDTSLSPKERKRKRHHRSHKRKREGKRYTETDLT